MRVVVQRVSYGSVTVKEENYFREIKTGLVLLVGVTHTDTVQDAEFTAAKCMNLRIFEDEAGKMNLSLKDCNGSLLIISQFTLYGDCRKGNRPNFMEAARPEQAIPLYEHFVNYCKKEIGEESVATGIFGAMMDVVIHNAGPVTVIVESKEK